MKIENLIVILGPTCSGKTSLALKLASELNGELLSADSRQVYKYMDIGTGKLPLIKKTDVVKNSGFWEINSIKVNGYDLVYPNEKYSVFDYAKYGENKLNEINIAKKIPLVVGGTGFYIDVLTGRATTSNISPQPEFRNAILNLDTLEIFKRLKKKNPEKARFIDPKNKYRLIRALEIETFKSKKNETSVEKKTNSTFIGITTSRENLYKNADLWVEGIFKAGVLEETEKLIAMGYQNTQPLNGFIYSDIKEYLAGAKNLEETKQRIKFEMHAYIRRQLTWFNRNLKINWFLNTDKDLFKKVLKLIELNYGK